MNNQPGIGNFETRIKNGFYTSDFNSPAFLESLENLKKYGDGMRMILQPECFGSNVKYISLGTANNVVCTTYIELYKDDTGISRQINVGGDTIYSLQAATTFPESISELAFQIYASMRNFGGNTGLIEVNNTLNFFTTTKNEGRGIERQKLKRKHEARIQAETYIHKKLEDILEKNI